MDIQNMTKKQLQEESLIDLTYFLLTESKQPMTVQQLVDEMRRMIGCTVKEIDARKVQFYTDLNIDGRFVALNDGNWGLREWYPVDQLVEETAPVVKTRKKKKRKDDDEYEEELEEELYDDEDYDEEDDEDEDDEEVVDEDDLDLVDEDLEDELLEDDDEDLDLVDEEIELDDEDEDEDDEEEL